MIVHLKDGRVQNRTTILDRLENDGINVFEIYQDIGKINLTAKKLGVGIRTLQRWLQKKNEFGNLKIPQWKIEWLKKYYNQRKEIVGNKKIKNHSKIFPNNLHINKIAKALKIHRCTVYEYFNKFNEE